MYAPTADLNQKKNIVRASPGKLLSRDFQVTVDESAEWKMENETECPGLEPIGNLGAVPRRPSCHTVSVYDNS